MKNGWNTVHLELDEIALFVRGGAVLPTQEPDVTTKLARCKPLGAIFGNSEMPENLIHRYLFFDDGDSIEIEDFLEVNFSRKNNKNLVGEISTIGNLNKVRNELGCTKNEFTLFNNLKIFGVESTIIKEKFRNLYNNTYNNKFIK